MAAQIHPPVDAPVVFTHYIVNQPWLAPKLYVKAQRVQVEARIIIRLKTLLIIEIPVLVVMQQLRGARVFVPILILKAVIKSNFVICFVICISVDDVVSLSIDLEVKIIRGSKSDRCTACIRFGLYY